MLGLSINESVVILFALGMIGFSSLAVAVENTRSSIINFLIACMFVCGYIALVSDTIISVVIAIIYVSMLSLFLTITYEEKYQESHIDTYITATVLMLFIISLLIYKNSSARFISENDSSHYVGIAEITLITSLLFLFVLSGIISLNSKKIH